MAKEEIWREFGLFIPGTSEVVKVKFSSKGKVSINADTYHNVENVPIPTVKAVEEEIIERPDIYLKTMTHADPNG